jgi:hypothetical protein
MAKTFEESWEHSIYAGTALSNIRKPIFKDGWHARDSEIEAKDKQIAELTGKIKELAGKWADQMKKSMWTLEHKLPNGEFEDYGGWFTSLEDAEEEIRVSKRYRPKMELRVVEYVRKEPTDAR